jgi:TPP-dependent indolepyruvate ferredoxin oxidoreductase alpha subunit
VLVILDDGTTAMTGMPERPALGRSITSQTGKIIREDLAGTFGAKECMSLMEARARASSLVEGKMTRNH